MINKIQFKKAIILLALIGIIAGSPEVIAAAGNALRVCFSSVVPALFPFMVLSSLYVDTFAADTNGPLIRLLQKIFGFSAWGTGVFICGMLCGYPIGAKCAAEQYKSGNITSSEAETLIACANKSGPLFVIGVVGSGLLSSTKAGVVLYCIHIATAIMAAICLKPYTYIKHSCGKAKKKSTNLTEAICRSVTNILNVCGFIVFFAVVNSLAKPLTSSLNEPLRCLGAAFVEITDGIVLTSKSNLGMKGKIIIISSVLGWSGLCVHMQVKNAINGLGLKLKKYYVVKIAESIASGVLAAIILYVSDMSKKDAVSAGAILFGAVIAAIVPGLAFAATKMHKQKKRVKTLSFR